MSNVEKFQTQRLGKGSLYYIFENMAKHSNCAIIREKQSDDANPFELYSIVLPDGFRIKVHVYLKNITGAGWSDKPEIKRIQIRKPLQLPKQRRDDFYILCGLCNYNSENVLVVWDPWNYMTHKTACSCYVFISSLEKAINGGFFHGLNKGKEVMTCTAQHFGELIREISSRYC